TADRNRSHWSTSKTPSYTKSVSWQHHPMAQQKIKSVTIKAYNPRRITYSKLKV
ncbi:transposase, partial [Escherichia coli]